MKKKFFDLFEINLIVDCRDIDFLDVNKYYISEWPVYIFPYSYFFMTKILCMIQGSLWKIELDPFLILYCLPKNIISKKMIEIWIPQMKKIIIYDRKDVFLIKWFSNILFPSVTCNLVLFLSKKLFFDQKKIRENFIILI
jgi:hypothetical protein